MILLLQILLWCVHAQYLFAHLSELLLAMRLKHQSFSYYSHPVSLIISVRFYNLWTSRTFQLLLAMLSLERQLIMIPVSTCARILLQKDNSKGTTFISYLLWYDAWMKRNKYLLGLWDKQFWERIRRYKMIPSRF